MENEINVLSSVSQYKITKIVNIRSSKGNGMLVVQWNVVKNFCPSDQSLSFKISHLKMGSDT